MSRGRRETAAHIRRLLDEEGESVRANAGHFNDRRLEAMDGFDRFEALRAEARAVKEDAIERLPELVDRATERVEDEGGTVYLADDAADANRYIEGVVGDGETVVKSKSMTTEEIELNDHLAECGIEAVETDLGEFVVQVADGSPSHIVGPAIHWSREGITALFEDRFDPEESLDSAEALTAFAREHLGERIRDADVGVTGANFVLADSGTVVLVTNEGNARKTAVTPDAHVAVAGVEKLVPSFAELEPFVELIARSATGQSIANYVSLLTPPTDSPTIDFDRPDEPLGDAADREFHLVLLDNGRMAMREDEQLRETLYCIRCGACANSCANFQHVGGHAFGGETYSGGIATGWEAGIYGEETAAGFNDLCTGCSRCTTACPVDIDIPWINTVVRDRVNRGRDPGRFDFLVDGLSPDAEPGKVDPAKRLFGNVDRLASLGSALAPASNRLADAGPVRAAMERALGVDRRRDLPEFRRETLRNWFAGRGAEVDPAEADREAVLYPDVYTNHVHVERGKAAVRTLEALGVHVRIPDVPESGRAPLSQGMVATAEERAAEVADALADHLDAGRDVVVVEPSDLGMFREDYGKLLDEEAASRLADASYDVMEYVFGLLENGADPEDLRGGDGERVVYHGHCQARTLGVSGYATAVLDRLDYDVAETDVECCGMAGSFGYKTEYYELSVDVGESLAEQLAEHPERAVVAGGTSCGTQIEDVAGRDVRHPVELVDPGRE